MDNKKGLNTNSNGYILVYATALVLVVAFILAFVYQSLKPMSDANVEIDKKKQILASLNMRNVEKSEIESTYDATIQADMVIDANAKIVKEGKDKFKDGFTMTSKDIDENHLPVYQCNVNGETKYVLPLFGKGMWGGIWGYLALNADKQTVFGAYFNHEGETAGLGARIVEDFFQKEFEGKKILKNDKMLSVVKFQTVKDAEIECDGITGATNTSIGVHNMIQSGIESYMTFIKK